MKRLVAAGVAIATGNTVRAVGAHRSDEQVEALMAALDAGAFDEVLSQEIEQAVAAVPFAQPVAFDDLKEANVADWARRRGVHTR